MSRLLTTLALVTCTFLCAAGFAAPAFSQDRPEKPNVVLLLADDLGWQDVGCYDIDEPCPYETPNIDRLSQQGVMFRQAYSPAPTCAPSRAAILSGKHPARTQKTHVVGGAPPSPHAKNSPLISPWYSGRMKLSEITIAEALRENGYRTGHAGKWHVAIQHFAFPQPVDQGFDFSLAERGVTRRMRPDRLSGFASEADDDPYQLDEDGFPFHQNVTNAVEFMGESKSQPFFLYHATYLVHAPIHSRSERLLRKYCEKMNVPFPSDPDKWELEGQRNPFYGAMVEMLDHYVGKVLRYLETTEDPRWPGHRLSENTYVIFTSDNGGMEQHPGEIITDNYPLDKGKINAKEGGVRVPLIIRGPGIAPGTESDVMVNGLDFYPTILSWTGTSKPAQQHLDGADLSSLLASDPKDASMIVDRDGKPRDSMFWHFPHSSMQSTLRVGGYKLIRNWSDVLQDGSNPLELYRLYDERNQRVDIEEANNLVAEMPEKAAAMNEELQKRLDETAASPPFLNPNCSRRLPRQDQVCEVSDHGRDGNIVWAKFQTHGAKVVKANLIYTDNGGERYEEWYRTPAKIDGDRVQVELPEGATHYVFNLIDENHYLVSYPTMRLGKDSSEKYSKRAIAK
ncbi:sulfatase [Rhodopirellula baltica]|uniref:N-acetylgalactosamine 6-sulfate sulfatase (GALNS) n=1 Tax=Rhodopirellula baltica SWK14 TaxID=993516 RepID=L7CPJ2_RHOBT|nr:sulfatase [Rhodopirellula baltica]ELP35547.1 N-acetylgalactosamine 6-sulfate sulfatase (GALNS) [Rhodopirellula baltica SWK14]